MEYIVPNQPYDLAFLMVSETDHITGVTGLESDIVIELALNGPPFAVPLLTTITEIGYGWYTYIVSPFDVSVPGVLMFHATAPGADPSDQKVIVGNIPSNTYAMQTDVITDDAVSADAVTKIQSGLATASSVSNISSRIPDALVAGNIKSNVQVVSSGALASIAEAILTYDWDNIVSTASRSLLNAARFLRNKFSTTANPGYVTVYEEDDTTEAYQKPLVTDAAAQPIVEG